jgi:phage-related protein
MITADIQGLEPGARVELFELDATMIANGGLLRFHGYEQAGTIWWQGTSTRPGQSRPRASPRLPKGSSPRPSFGGQRGRLDLVAVHPARRSGWRQADAPRHAGPVPRCGQFPRRQPERRSATGVPARYLVHRAEDRRDERGCRVRAESALDFQGVMLPRRQIIANLCPFPTRARTAVTPGTRCSTPTTTRLPTRRSTCARSGLGAAKSASAHGCLNFGGFPAAALIQS